MEHEPGLSDVGELYALHGPEPSSEVVQAGSLESAAGSVRQGDTKPKLGEPRWLNLRAALVAAFMEQAHAFSKN